MQTRQLFRFKFLLGLLCVLVYWVWHHPSGMMWFGYMEDYCSDLVRQLFYDDIKSGLKNGRWWPSFISESVMYPTGASIPFMSWSIERDGMGALFWGMGKQIPYLWILYGVSLGVSYLFIYSLVKKWTLNAEVKSNHLVFKVGLVFFATYLTLFNLPRQAKAYYHFEHLLHHWIVFAFFWDARIWLEWVRHRKASVQNELWRLLMLLGMFFGTATYWGPLLLEWLVFRLFLLGVIFKSREFYRFQFKFLSQTIYWKKWLGLLVVTIAILSWWYIPLFLQFKNSGSLFQPVWWFGSFWALFESPLLSQLFQYPVERHETQQALGWSIWYLTFLLSFFYIKEKGFKFYLKISVPFATLFILFSLYLVEGNVFFVQSFLRSYFPFFSFFRVASRLSLFYPILLGSFCFILFAEIFKNLCSKRFKKYWSLLGVGLLLVVLEIPSLFKPAKQMEMPSENLTQLLTEIKNLSGEAVLDLPFCVAGGNRVCTDDQCPFYPQSTVGQCFRMLHEKKVFGLYQARMTFNHCKNYQAFPYQNWMEAWKLDRCFNDLEWQGLCQLINQQPEITAILVYPNQWKALQKLECIVKLETVLGQPMGKAIFGENFEVIAFDAQKARANFCRGSD